MRIRRFVAGLGMWAAGVVVVAAGACSSSTSPGAGTGGHGGGSAGAPGSGGAGGGGVASTGGATGVGGGPVATGGGPAPGGATGTSSGGAGGAKAGSGGAGGANTPSGGAGGGSAGPGGAAGFGYGGPSRCATAGVAFCEDFENGLDTTIWSVTRNGDTSLDVDNMRAARGSKALHFKTTAGDFARITEKKSFPATNNVLYGRMFIWFEDDITTDGHFSLAEAQGSTGDPAFIRFGGQFQEFGVGTDHGASGDWTDTDRKQPKIPSKTWICTEFEFKGDTNEFRVWVDDQPQAGLTTGASKHTGFVIPPLDQLWFGWWMYNKTEPQELWIDEIAVDFKPIGCAK